jgi:hypothetical protein
MRAAAFPNDEKFSRRPAGGYAILASRITEEARSVL